MNAPNPPGEPRRRQGRAVGPGRAAMVVFLLVAIASLALGALPSPRADAAAPEAEPALHLERTRFSVPTGAGYSVALRLSGLALPEAAFNPVVPATTVPATTVPGPVGTTAPPVVLDPYFVTATVYGPIQTVDDFDDFSVDDAQVIDAVSVPLYTVAAPTDDGAAIDLTFDGGGAARAFRLTQPGLYPIRLAVIHDGTPVATLDTFFEQLGEQVDTRGPVTLRIVARLPDIGPTPNPAMRESALESTRQLIELGNTIEQPISAFIAPSVVHFLRREHPGMLTDLAAALAGETVVPLPATRISPDTAVANGIEDNFADSIERGRATISASFPTSTIDTSVALLDTPTSRAGLGLWSDNGIDMAVVPTDVYAAAVGAQDHFDGTMLVNGEAAGDRVMPLVVVPTRMRDLGDPLEADETALDRAVELLSFIAAVRAQSAPDLRTLVLSSPTVGIPNPAIIAALSAATDDPTIVWGNLVDVSTSTNGLFANGSPVSVYWQATPESDLTRRLEQVHSARLIIADVLSMMPDDDERRTRWPEALNDSLSTLIDDDVAGQLIDGTIAEAAGLKAAVSPPEAFKFTLTGPDSTLRFQLTNNADTPLTVIVNVSSDRLSAPSETTVELTPNAVSEVAVDVTTRSNGTANLRIALRTPAGNPVGEPVTMTGRVNTYSGLGQLFSVGALLVLVTWWVTHIRRRRRRVRATADAGDDGSIDSDLAARDATTEPADDPATQPGSTDPGTVRDDDG